MMMMLDKEKNNLMIKIENNHYLLTNKNFRGGLWAYLLEEYEGGVSSLDKISGILFARFSTVECIPTVYSFLMTSFICKSKK